MSSADLEKFKAMGIADEENGKDNENNEENRKKNEEKNDENNTIDRNEVTVATE
jgi:hypothetical protein